MDNTSFNNDIHLTYEELVSYGQGNLSNKEMHRLELHLISCALCTEALEGIAKVEEAVLYKSLANIRTNTETKSSKSFSISKKQWLSMAATVALIAVVSIIIMLMPERQEITIAEEQPIEKELLAVDDSSSQNFDDQDSLNNIRKQEDSLLAVASIPTPAVDREVRKDDVAEAEAKGLDVTDLPADNIAIAEANDTALLADNISLDITEDEVEEDKDTAERSKKTAAPAAGVETQAAREAFSADSKTEEISNYKAAEPEKGMKSYSRYLKRNLKYPDSAKENNIGGEVILQLTINSFGSITNINIIQSLGYGCDEEAIRLIKEGPAWVPGNNNDGSIEDRVNITVPFKL